MKALSGTWRLVRLAVRRDRIKIPIWIIVIIGMVAVTVPALEEAYGTPEAQMTYAVTMSSSLVGRAFGVIDGASMGSILMLELSVFLTFLIAFMSTTLVVRHTRQNEESGSAELISSARVGRYASLTAALITAAILNVSIGLLSALVLSQFDVLSDSGAWGLGAIFAVVGISFAALAAIAVQLTENSRTANGIAGASIAAAFLLRAVGDMTGDVEGLSVVSAWPSWLSPLGWAQQIHPFTQQNWWVFSLFAGLIVVCIGLAYLILSRRDVGAGILPARKGPARASHWLRRPFGIAWRLQRVTLAWWIFISALLGVLYGAMTKEFESLVSESEVAQQYVVALGGTGNMTDAFLGAMLGLMALAVMAYIVQATLKIRSEEVGGRLEPMLSAAVGRLNWILPHIVIIICGLTVLMITTAVAMAITSVLVIDAEWSVVTTYIEASLVYIPALLVIVGFIVLGIGLVPRLMTAIAWSLFIFLMLVNQLGALLDLPSWIIDISPFSHTPAALVESVTAQPLIIMSLVALAMLVVGLYAFRRRDIVTM